LDFATTDKFVGATAMNDDDVEGHHWQVDFGTQRQVPQSTKLSGQYGTVEGLASEPHPCRFSKRPAMMPASKSRYMARITASGISAAQETHSNWYLS